MPANRSRTERWRDNLWQIYERGGSIEFALASDTSDAHNDLVWRVRLLSVSDDEISVEQPFALGREIEVAESTPLVCAITIGQNRWMFRSSVTRRSRARGQGGREHTVLHVALPEHVERCQRRAFYRVATASLNLPQVQCWHLISPISAVAAEVANKALITGIASGRIASDGSIPEIALPEVGPRFQSSLVNIGGGGAGIVVSRESAQAANRFRTLWAHIDLRPRLPAPLGVVAKIAHTHIDSLQNVYLGLAFEFGHNLSHRDFIVSQILKYVEATLQQRATLPGEAA